MKYSEEFIQLIDETENGEFIGFGNPNSKILFVGKECGLDLTNHVDKFVIVTFIDYGIDESRPL